MIKRYGQEWLPFGMKGLALFPFIFYYYKKEDVSLKLSNHEEYHYRHQLRYLVIPWFIIYSLLWLYFGYENHPWEKLAREAE